MPNNYDNCSVFFTNQVNQSELKALVDNSSTLHELLIKLGLGGRSGLVNKRQRKNYDLITELSNVYSISKELLAKYK